MICIALLVIQNLHVIFLWNMNVFHRNLILLALQIWTLIWSPSELTSSTLCISTVRCNDVIARNDIGLVASKGATVLAKCIVAEGTHHHRMGSHQRPSIAKGASNLQRH